MQKFGFCLQDLKIFSETKFLFEVRSNGGATCIFVEIIAKDNLNIVNLMQTFENLLFQNYWTKFIDIAHK